MPPTLFLAANATAFLLWAVLILARFVKPMRPITDLFCGYVAPALFSVAYLAILAINMPGAEGEMGSLAGVQLLFSQPYMMLVGWLHYLAFDLFVGGWIARTGDAEGVSPWLLAPILLLTLLFGPVGFLLFVVLRQLRGRRTAMVGT